MQRHIQARRNQLRVNLDWTAEAKVILMLVYYMVLGTVVLTIFTKHLTGIDKLREAMDAYFNCEAGGLGRDSFDMASSSTNSSGCDRGSVERLVHAAPSAIAFALLGVYPLINLVYIINLKELKEKFTFREKRQVEIAYRSRGKIQSSMFHPVHPGINGVNFQRQVTSSFCSTDYTRPNTFKPLPPTPAPT